VARTKFVPDEELHPHMRDDVAPSARVHCCEKDMPRAGAVSAVDRRPTFGITSTATAWLDRVRRSYGSEPTVQYFETPLVTDNAIGQTIIDGEPTEV
jgi:hypothetical protein